MPSEIIGSVLAHRDGHGFVVPDDGGTDVFLAPNDMRAVLHQDRVRVQVTGSDRRGRPTGRVVELIERPNPTLIGRLMFEGGLWLLAPEDPRFGQDILLPQGPGAAQAGQIVVVGWLDPPALYAQPTARVVEVLGDMDQPGMEIEIAVRKFELPHIFSPACEAEAAALPNAVRKRDWASRIDLRDVPLVTIDGEDARDFDDAVYCQPTTIGRARAWRLIVAIADVSHYVRSGRAIDADAYDRATSVYFPRRVIPMLPEKLSNGLCSLNPHVDRLCMVCDMVIDAKGQLHAYQFYPAVMHSHARLTYTQVAAALQHPEQAPAAIAARLPELQNLSALFDALLAQRNQRGAVDFDTVETQVICDDAGHIQRIEPRQRNRAHRIIEECMLAANVCAADFIERNAHAALFRIHDRPSPDKVQALRNYLRALALPFELPEQPEPADFQHIANATRDRSDAQPIHSMLLRSMMQAVYTPENSGHFGLAYLAYTHFTSPIRRYPDLLVHRVIKAILQRNHYVLPNLPTPGATQTRIQRQITRSQPALAAHAHDAHADGRAKNRAPKSGGVHAQATRATQAKLHYRPVQPPSDATARAQQRDWQAAALHCSANERRADEASRDVLAWLKCQYMRSRVGEVFAGRVSAVTSFGVFVTLDDVYIEGFIHVSELGRDYFQYDEVRQELRGQRSGQRFGVGTALNIQVASVDIDSRRIDFMPAPEDAQPVQQDAIAHDSTAAATLPSARAKSKTPTRTAPKPSIKVSSKTTSEPSTQLKSKSRSRKPR